MGHNETGKTQYICQRLLEAHSKGELRGIHEEFESKPDVNPNTVLCRLDILSFA